MLPTKVYAVPSAGAALEPWQIERREPRADDVLIDILYCGICHSDVHFAHGMFPGAAFPAVPGHEIVGKVVNTGGAVTRHKVGDLVGVGCIVDACGHCHDCEDGEEQFCAGMIPTYSGIEDGKPTYGGYSQRITVNEDFVVKLSPKLDPAAAAPLLCAGITLYSPLRHWNVGKGSKVAVIGLGGLGHMGVKLAAAMGAEVTVFSTSEKKRADAMRLGAHDFAVSTNPETFAKLAGKFDLILNTVSARVDYNAYISTLKRDGTLVLLGIPDGPVELDAFNMLYRRRSLGSSMIGGIRETQEMLNFCAEHGIVSDIEMIRMDQVNEAYERMLKSDVRYRFVIDIAGSLK